MKLLKYRQFNESKQNIDSICKEFGIKNYTINEDGSIDVDGGVFLVDRELYRLPLKFRNVSGHFNCSDNRLISLEGAPSQVGGHFYCYFNQLTSLEGAPSQVGGDFNCYDNQLTSLEGCPSSVGYHFDCSGNQLTNLEGAPSQVGGDFNCHDNQLTTLEGCPSSVGGNFDFDNNSDLISLEGFPLHYDVDKEFHCKNTKLEEIYELFDTIDAIEWINEFEAINYDSDVPEVYYMKLLDVWESLDKEPIAREKINLKNYKLL